MIPGTLREQHDADSAPALSPDAVSIHAERSEAPQKISCEEHVIMIQNSLCYALKLHNVEHVTLYVITWVRRKFTSKKGTFRGMK